MINNSNSAHWLIFQNEKLLTKKIDATYRLLLTSELSCFENELTHQHLLTQLNEENIYCAELPDNMILPEDYVVLPLKKAIEALGPAWFTIAAKAIEILNWDKNHHYCGKCGAITNHKKETFERICAACSLIFYPRISPSVIVLIQKNDEVLMARSPHFPPGAYGLIAGFVEAGESFEEAAHREIKEEVNITVNNLQYFGSQPWPFPDSLMVAFIADYEAGELIINHNEIEEAGWYRFDNLPGGPSSNISIARKLINHFIELKTKSSNNI